MLKATLTFDRLFETTAAWVSCNCAVYVPEGKKLNWWASICRNLHALEIKRLYERVWWKFMAAIMRKLCTDVDECQGVSYCRWYRIVNTKVNK